MADRVVRACACPDCRSGHEHSERQLHHQINLLMSRLDEQQRRWFAAVESKRAGYGGDTLFALITGLHVDTIRRGREELDADLQSRPTDRVRRPGAGRPSREKKTRPSATTSSNSRNRPQAAIR